VNSRTAAVEPALIQTSGLNPTCRPPYRPAPSFSDTANIVKLSTLSRSA
jgi:hypothetical protein